MRLRVVRPLALIALASSVAVAPVLGQQKTQTPPTTPAKTGKAGISGVILDSLNAGYLAGAEVVVQGANVSRLTDSSGKFRFDSLPPGNYQVGVFHPLLDTLGLSLATQPFHLGPDQTELFARTLLLSKADSGVKTGNATVSGRVLLQGAPSNAGSRVEVVGTDAIAMTNERGEFT